MRGFFYRNALVLILGAVFVLVGAAYLVSTGTHRVTVVTQQQEIAELDATMQTKLAAAKAEQQAVVDDVLGTNAARVAQDTEVIREFIGTATTWKNGEEYTSARESLMRKYKLGEDSQFLKVFFPKPISNTDSSGNKFYVVDTEGLNSRLSSIDPKVLGVSGTQYKYMVLADISSSSKDGKASANKTSVIYLTLDGEGLVTDVSGYASVSKPLGSN